MKNLVLVSIVVGAIALSGCSTVGGGEGSAQIHKPFGWGYSASARRAMAAKFGKTAMAPGDFIWRPEPGLSGPSEIVISLSSQMAYVYRGGNLIAASTISSGTQGRETPVGRFPILDKARIHKSNRYSAAPMPFMQRLTWTGVALHGGVLPGYPASHGCIRLPMKFAEKLFATTQMGNNVYIED